MELCYGCWNKRRHTNGLVAWSALQDQGTHIWISNIIFKLHQELFMQTNGYCVTKACPFYTGSDISIRLYPQLIVLVHHTVPFTKMISQNWTYACWHQLGIAMARCFAWMEQQSTDTVGPRWTATLVCHMHRSSLELCILCCNFTSRTMDPQDSRKEHERAAETRATGLHLGNSAANIFDLERLWQLDYGGCCTWTLDANEAGFCSFHLA